MTKTFATLAGALVCLASTGPGIAASTAAGAGVEQGPHARLDALFARWNSAASPGCAVAVSREGRAIATGVYGMASLELGVANRIDSLFEAGSDSKQFTAAAILMLARSKKLSLDDDIRSYLPEIPDYGAKVTIRHLLHHTSGLRDWGAVAAISGWPRNTRTATNQDALDIAAAQSAPNYAPGEHYLYSNTNYNLLAVIVQRVSGQSLADYTREHIFVPLGMTHTLWRDDHGEVVPGRTGAYEYEDGVYRNEQVIEDAYGNGGLLTTVGDLVKWQAALDADSFGPGFTKAMETPTRLNDGTPISYALALVKLDHNGTREVSHSGSTGGYRAWMARYPEYKLAVSLLCNAGNADTSSLGRAVADIFLPGHTATAYSPQGPLPTGLYADGMTGFPVRFATDAHGELTANGTVLRPLAPDRWAQREDIFDFSGEGLVREHREGESISYRKVDPVSRFDPAPYLGRYCSADTASCLEIEQDGRELTFSGPRWSGQPLAPAYADVFTGTTGPRSGRIVLRFDRDSDGTISGLRFGEWRAYAVAFQRVTED